MSTATEAFVVACTQTIVGPFKTRGTAERRLAAILKLDGCHERHEVRAATEADLETARP